MDRYLWPHELPDYPIMGEGPARAVYVMPTQSGFWVHVIEVFRTNHHYL
jgi:hypothetical protein